jgi:hypothetical protein
MPVARIASQHDIQIPKIQAMMTSSLGSEVPTPGPAFFVAIIQAGIDPTCQCKESI